MNQKIYPNDVLEQIQAIGSKLSSIFNTESTNLRTISKFANMSVNSVKSVLAGKTGNIASYALVAKALGTDLISVVSDINQEINHSAPAQPVVAQVSETISNDSSDGLLIQ